MDSLNTFIESKQYSSLSTGWTSSKPKVFSHGKMLELPPKPQEHEFDACCS
jgi:hypothetical protein